MGGSPHVRTLLRRSWVRVQERRAPRGGAPRGSMAGRSRSFSTMHTTLIDPTPLGALNPHNPSIGSLAFGAGHGAAGDVEGHCQGLGGSSGSVAPLMEAPAGGVRSDAFTASQTSILAEDARVRGGAPGSGERNGRNNGSCVQAAPGRAGRGRRGAATGAARRGRPRARGGVQQRRRQGGLLRQRPREDRRRGLRLEERRGIPFRRSRRNLCLGKLNRRVERNSKDRGKRDKCTDETGKESCNETRQQNRIRQRNLVQPKDTASPPPPP
ncbi:hypothetical protein C7M84_011724 [Penaeus vannamei]|uniref:Uncharacterized protein n=1 Tax=Penaeus vannamei TaxID=6689 RepID=A0A3R7PL33_PENVA|nr:hypothetical protein C7M84_011724 [Penaeus vannamei]